MAALSVVLAGLYLQGALKRARDVNVTMDWYDQSAYMAEADGFHREGLSYVTDRNRMPLFPFLMSRFRRPDMSDADFFMAGKAANAVLSLLLLAALFAVLRRFLSGLTAFNMTVITAFTVFIFKAPFFQCEVLYFFLAFLAFLFQARAIRAPGITSALAAGALSALAYLAKASALLSVYVFTAVAFARAAMALAAGAKKGDRTAVRKTAILWGSSLAAFAVAFTVLTGPYLATNKRMFGTFFFNVATDFMVWHDSAPEASPFYWYYLDPRVPYHEKRALRGPGRYWREHSPREIGARFAGGAKKILVKALKSYGYVEYALFYGSCALLLVALRWTEARRWARREAAVLGFAGIFFSASLALFAWYAPINSGPRFYLSLFLPFLFSAALTAERLSRLREERLLGWRGDLFRLLNGAAAAVLAADVYVVVTRRIYQFMAGD